MLERIERSWRVLATGLCFTTFGLGSVLLGVVVFPLLGLAVRDRERHVAIVRQLIRHGFALFVGMMRMARVITLEVHGRERLRGGGRLILANHPTLIDVVLLMALVERSDCVIKGALGRNPITRGTVRAAGFVFNDQDGEGLLQDCVRSLRAGNNLIVFPEGTRSPVGEPLKLQRGAARIAVLGGIDITPVRIRCTPCTLSKGDKWYRVPARRARFRIDIDPTIAVAPFMAAAPHPAAAARRLTEHLTDHFSREHELASA